MTNTFTKTMTIEERKMDDLNQAVYAKLMSLVLNRDNESYMKVLPDGSISEKPQNNIFEAGILNGEGYIINKKAGQVEWPGNEIKFEYIDDEGKIESFGEEYEKATIQLKDQEVVGLLDFANHPEVEDYLDKINQKFEVNINSKNTQESPKL